MSELELKSKVMAGEVKSTDLVWREGMPSWVELGRVPELASALTVTGAGGRSAPPALGADPYRGPQATAAAPGDTDPRVSNYLWQSIAVTLLCCLPLGVVAIIYAAKVEPALRVGDVAGAKAASDSAKLWCWLAFGLGLVSTLAYLAFVFLGVAASQP